MIGEFSSTISCEEGQFGDILGWVGTCDMTRESRGVEGGGSTNVERNNLGVDNWDGLGRVDGNSSHFRENKDECGTQRSRDEPISRSKQRGGVTRDISCNELAFEDTYEGDMSVGGSQGVWEIVSSENSGGIFLWDSWHEGDILDNNSNGW
jgi:hypothetical protein